MALLGLFTALFPSAVQWIGQYQQLLSLDLSVYPWLAGGMLPVLLGVAVVFGILAVVWPVE